MKSYIYWFAFIFSLFSLCASCDDKEANDDGSVPLPGNLFDSNIQAILLDANKNNLLDPATKGYVNPDSIRIYSLVDGKKILSYNPYLDFPYFVSFGETYDGIKYVTLFVASNPQDGYVLNYVQWTENWVDTIRCQINANNKHVIDKVFVNDKLVELDSALLERFERPVIFTRPD